MDGKKKVSAYHPLSVRPRKETCSITKKALSGGLLSLLGIFCSSAAGSCFFLLLECKFFGNPPEKEIPLTLFNLNL